MGARHEGVSGKWDALTEERNELRERLDELAGRNLELQNLLSELQFEKTTKLTQLKAALRDALASLGRAAPPLWLEELDAAIAIAEDREARVREREQDLRIGLNDEEQEAWDALSSYMRIVIHRWKLRANTSEIAAAVHVLQGAVTQHMLHRLSPAEWSSWWDKSNDQEET